MGEIYEAAQITLVAAAGNDASHGLPGVHPKHRPEAGYQKLNSVNILEAFDLRKVYSATTASTWASRAWTFQEFYRARRRLIFTEEASMFVCNSGIRHEIYEETDSFAAEDTLIPWLPPCPLLDSLASNGTPDPIHRAMYYLEDYSDRALSLDSDALNAILGALQPLAKEHIFQISGVPFRQHALADNVAAGLSYRGESTVKGTLCNICGLRERQVRICARETKSVCTHRGEVEMALLWYHDLIHRRRRGFPSWSPIAWTGKISWYKSWVSDEPILHSFRAMLVTEGETHQLSTLVPTQNYSSTNKLQWLEFKARTVALELVDGGLWWLQSTTEGSFQVAMPLSNEYKAVCGPHWDVDPSQLLACGTTIRGALVYGMDEYTNSGYVLIIASYGDYYERVGIVELSPKLSKFEHTGANIEIKAYEGRCVICRHDLQPLADDESLRKAAMFVQGLPEKPGAWWPSVFTTEEVIKLR
jgi:hypothetical protein